MDDKFLYQLRPPVRQEFARNLRARLDRRYPDASVVAVATPRLAWKLALVILLAFAIALFALPDEVRAQALDWIKNVAGFTVQEQIESPMNAVEEGKVQPTVYNMPSAAVPQALADAPFPVSLPTWTPEGYALEGEAVIANSNDWVMLTWRGPQGSEITMLVEQEYTGYSIPTGEGSSQEIQVNKQPALLVRGAWDEQHRWDPELGLAISWLKDGHDYRLIYAEREPEHNALAPISGDVETIKEQLVRMAESID